VSGEESVAGGEDEEEARCERLRVGREVGEMGKAE